MVRICRVASTVRTQAQSGGDTPSCRQAPRGWSPHLEAWKRLFEVEVPAGVVEVVVRVQNIMQLAPAPAARGAAVGAPQAFLAAAVGVASRAAPSHQPQGAHAGELAQPHRKS